VTVEPARPRINSTPSAITAGPAMAPPGDENGRPEGRPFVGLFSCDGFGVTVSV
jgi:hypothetical protein